MGNENGQDYSPQITTSRPLGTSAMVRRRGGFACSLSRDERGATLVEYSILVGLLAVTVIVTILFVGDWAKDKWASLDSTLESTCGELPDSSSGGGCAEGRN